MEHITKSILYVINKHKNRDLIILESMVTTILRNYHEIEGLEYDSYHYKKQDWVRGNDYYKDFVEEMEKDFKRESTIKKLYAELIIKENRTDLSNKDNLLYLNILLLTIRKCLVDRLIETETIKI